MAGKHVKDRFKIRDFLNADVFISSITGNVCTLIPVVLVFYLPGVFYSIAFEGTFHLLFLLVGFLGGLYAQRSFNALDHVEDSVIKATEMQIQKMKGEGPQIDEEKRFPSPTYMPDAGAAAFNEVFASMWPEVAKGLNESLVCEATDVGGGYELTISKMGIDCLSGKFESVTAIRTPYQDPSHACVCGKVVISGTPESSINLHSDSALKPDIDCKIQSLILTANLYCRVDCVFWKIWIWFDKDVNADIKLDCDVSVFPIPLSFVSDLIAAQLIKFTEKDPMPYDTVDWDAPDPQTMIDKGVEEYLKEVEGKVRGVVIISKMSANGLPATDKLAAMGGILKGNIMKSNGGTADPYLKISYDGNEVETKPITETLSPAWSESFNFVVHKAYAQIAFEIWDWDRGSKDDFMAKREMNMDTLTRSTKPQKFTLPLYPKGNLTVETLFIPDKPEEH